MSLYLVATTDFGPYERGDFITNSAAIDSVRLSDNASQVVKVSDEIIPPPAPPPAPPDLGSLQSAYVALATQNTNQDATLAAAAAVNSQQAALLTQQASLIAQQGTQIGALSTTVSQLVAAVNSGTTVIPPNLADDRPLAENDLKVLVTNANRVLVGDIR